MTPKFTIILATAAAFCLTTGFSTLGLADASASAGLPNDAAAVDGYHLSSSGDEVSLASAKQAKHKKQSRNPASVKKKKKKKSKAKTRAKRKKKRHFRKKRSRHSKKKKNHKVVSIDYEKNQDDNNLPDTDESDFEVTHEGLSQTEWKHQQNENTKDDSQIASAEDSSEVGHN